MIACVPLNDDIDHIAGSKDCPCEPEVRYQDPETGEIYKNGPFLIHNALDGREAVEVLLGEGLDGKKWLATEIDEW